MTTTLSLTSRVKAVYLWQNKAVEYIADAAGKVKGAYSDPLPPGFLATVGLVDDSIFASLATSFGVS